MTINIEVKYLNVKWADKDTVLKIEFSDLLPFESLNSDYQIESTTFKTYLPRIGFKILDQDILHTPYFTISNNEKKNLLGIKDPDTLEIWWIESSGWDKKNLLHHTELYRTVGNLHVVIQNQKIKIVNNSLDFTVEELESYLRSFKNDLWMIILNENGYIKGQIEKSIPNIFSTDLLKLLQEYADSVEQIVNKPTIELKETQALKPIKSVKPVNKTFMEIAVKGNPQYLTSRDFVESFDTADNRYIHYTLKRILYLTRQISVLGSSQQTLYEKIIKSETLRLNHFGNMKKVDHTVFESEIQSIERKVNSINCKIQESLVNYNNYLPSEQSTHRVVLTKKYGRDDSFGYFCEIINGVNFKEKYQTYLVVYLPGNFQIPELIHPSRAVEVEITGTIHQDSDKNKKGNKYFRLKFESVKNATLIRHPFINELSRLQARKLELERLDWLIPFTSRERQDVEVERKFVQKKISLANQNMEELLSVNHHLLPILKRLKTCKRFFNLNKISINSNFPNTMVFVQNPNYALAKSSFSAISKQNGMDENLFDSMLQIDEIGLVNISNLYEKWCLLQIIKVLTEVYRFSIEDRWQQRLINAVLNKKYDIAFKLSSPTLERIIILTYEKKLDSGKRPDFVIDVFSTRTDEEKRYVLDAKFKDTLNDEKLEAIIKGLYFDNEMVTNGKNYSEDERNSVFILHASHHAINHRTSPLEWGGQSDYGQTCSHKHGGVYLCPSYKHGRSFDNLQRLIGLILQESNVFEKSEQGITHNAFCIACGNSNKGSLQVIEKYTQSGNPKWEIHCNICGNLNIKSFCRSCRSTLNKNGYYWTYHRTRAEQPFNIVCPSCEEFL